MTHAELVAVMGRIGGERKNRYVRVTSRRNGELLAEHLYFTDTFKNAIEKFLAEYPEHNDCEVTAERYDEHLNEEHFRACVECGCVH